MRQTSFAANSEDEGEKFTLQGKLLSRDVFHAETLNNYLTTGHNVAYSSRDPTGLRSPHTDSVCVSWLIARQLFGCLKFAVVRYSVAPNLANEKEFTTKSTSAGEDVKIFCFKFAKIVTLQQNFWGVVTGKT